MDKEGGQNTAPKVAAATSVAAYRRIAVVFVLFTALVVALVFYVVFARATVVVMSEQREAQAEFIVDVAKEPLPGEVRGTVMELTDGVSQAFPAASIVKVSVPVEGRVRIASTLSRAQTLVATTRLLTADERLYRLKETVVVPANGAVEVDIFSDVPGEESAIGNAMFTIPGLNPSTRSFFTVSTVSPLAGGYTEVRMVTQGDIDSAADVLNERLAAALLERIRQDAADAGIPTSGEVVAAEPLDVTSDVPVGEDVETFTVTVRGRVVAAFYDKEKFSEVVRQRLGDSLPYDRSLLELDADRTQARIEKHDLLSGRANLRVTANGVSVMSTDAPYLDPERLAGISVEAARAYLGSIEGVSSVSISSSPIWSGRMPDIAENITVEVR